MQGRFNLNNLRKGDGTTNEAAVEQLGRILQMLEIEPSWAAAIADWVDADGEAGFPDGAEDSVYTSLTPPHRAANMTITRASELMVLNGFGAERYAKLAPYVTALPVGTKLNVCTASGIVLDSLSETEREFSLSPEDTAKRRADTCYPTIDALHNKLGDEEFNKVKNSLTDSSNYFRANVWVTIGTTQFTLYSLLARADQGPVRTILRSFGSE
jgi:general secretion pathway protein K